METDENLNRVLDILHELDSRLEPLQIQASAAKDYVHMTAELKEFDISLIVHDLEEAPSRTTHCQGRARTTGTTRAKSSIRNSKFTNKNGRTPHKNP